MPRDCSLFLSLVSEAFFLRAVESPDAPVPLGLSATRLIRLDPPGIALRARLQATLPAPVGRAAHIPRR